MILLFNFSDNLGPGIPDRYSESRCKRYYKNIISNFSKELSIEKISYEEENDDDTINDASIPDYSTWAVLGIFFFIPFALISLWYTSKAKKETRLRNIPNAIKKARKAKVWLILTFITGISIDIFFLLYDIINIQNTPQ